MPKQGLEEIIITTPPKRPYPLVTTFSSPASIQTTTNNKKKMTRERKVSFNEKVIVVCTSSSPTTTAEGEEDEPVKIRRHSTGEEAITHPPKSILIRQKERLGSLQEEREETVVFKEKITKSLKHFKNRLLFV